MAATPCRERRYPTVGLSWRGGSRKTRGGLRSLELADLLPLAAGLPRRFICLQRGDCSAEIDMARAAGMHIEHWPGVLDDMEDSAALIAALDLVVSVDNTMVHLAGAVGQLCWALLAHLPDWRYGIEGTTMPWYPSVQIVSSGRGSCMGSCDCISGCCTGPVSGALIVELIPGTE